MYSAVYGLMRKYLWQGGQEIRHHMRELDRTQWLSRPEIEAIQLKKIKALVYYAYEHVPLYRERYKKEDIHPQDINSFQDFHAIPFLTRDDVLSELNALISTKYKGGVFEDRTGGSTGRPMHFIMDRHTTWWSFAVETRYRNWYGIRPGDRRAWVWGNLKDFPSWRWQERLAAYAKRYRYLNAHTMSKSNMQAFAEMLLEWQPHMFRAYPWAISLFAQYLKINNINGIKPKLIETSGEKLTAHQRQLLEEVFKCPVAEHYASWEVYDIAYQCPVGGLHVSEDRYLELVSNDQIVEPGQIGEVVITSLTQYAMPFIRYKNEDLGIYESKPCVCGRGMPVLKEITGRTQDLLVRPDGQIVYGSIVDYITHDKPEVVQFQAYQPDQKHVEIRLLCREKVDSIWLENLRKEIQPYFGDEMRITLKIVDTIELTPAGKLKTVISDVKANML